MMEYQQKIGKIKNNGSNIPVDMNINPLNAYLGCLFRSATAERSLKVSSLAVEPRFIHRSADG